MSTGFKALVVVLGSLAVILSVVAILLVTAGGDEYEAPSKYDSKAWQLAMQEAGYYCAGLGIGGTDAGAIYTDEFKTCQRDNAERIYAEGNDK